MDEREIDFTYQCFRDIINHAKSISPIVTLKDRTSGGCIILRHDVDFDIFLAYMLSRIEKDMGIRSSFFIMTTCNTYNPNAPENRKLLKEMAQDGFEIGLHFDPTVYEVTNEQALKSHVDAEVRLLEDIIGQKVTSVSLHNPSVTGKFPIFEGYENAYSKEIFSDEFYISDSCRKFRGKNPFKFLQNAREHPLQMVLHPIHWSEKGDNYIEIFSKHILRSIESIDSSFKVNLTYKESLNGDSLKNLLNLEDDGDE